MPAASKPKPRGRPRAGEAPVMPDEILDAAFCAFARNGYDGVSVRTLNRELGVSHNLIHQRYGSKEGLWRAAVDRAFGRLTRELTMAFDPTVSDPLDQLNGVIRRFLLVSADHPELVAFMNIEAGIDGPRLDYIYENYVGPALVPLARLLEHLAAEGRIRPISLSTLHFLVTHGAAAQFTLTPLARRLDGTDPLNPDAVAAHAELAADLITNGLRL